MGGHGGLNILPQKRWNVYNYENREKVLRDEEQAAREEQLKRDQARKRNAEFRLERLRAAKGLAPLVKAEINEENKNQNQNEKEKKRSEPEPETSGDPGHINLFEGIKIFDPVMVPEKKKKEEEREEGWKKQKKMKKKEEVVVVGPEDEKYRLGYGVAGKGVKLPWYLQKPSDNGEGDRDRGEEGEKKKKSSGRKTLEELREERMKRERKEKERERALVQEKRPSRSDRDAAYGESWRFSSSRR